jgi:hypothetical protein
MLMALKILFAVVALSLTAIGWQAPRDRMFRRSRFS